MEDKVPKPEDIPPEQWAIYNALLDYVFNDVGEDPTKPVKSANHE